jgi:hypothetical protein
MVADHYALVEREMPSGYEQAEFVSNQGWLDAIAKASGNDACALPRANSDEDTLVDLSSGRSMTQHKAMARDYGVDSGWSDMDCVGPLDFLDALRELRGLEPCDRAYLGEEPVASAPSL